MATAKTPRKKKIVTTTVTTTTTTTVEDVNLNAYILLDRSGSMVSRWVEAIGSVNAYVNELKKGKTTGAVTIAVFDSHSYDIARSSPISKFEPLTEGEYSPRASTPLFDSFMKIAAQAEEEGGDKAVIIVMTDGAENSSREASQSDVKAKVQALGKRGFEVIFLGADFNNAQQAMNSGLGMNKFVSTTSVKLGATMSDLAMRSRAYAGASDTVYAASAGINYTEEDKKAAK